MATLSFVSSTFPEALGDPGDGGLCSYLDVCTAAATPASPACRRRPPLSSSFSASRLRRGPTAARFSSSFAPSTSNLVAETFSLFRPPNHPLCHSPRSSFLSSLPFAIFEFPSSFPHHRSASNSLLSLTMTRSFFAGIWGGCLMRSGYRGSMVYS